MLTYSRSRSKVKIVYLQTENCDSGQRREMESISVPSRNFGHHFVEEAGRLRFVQKDKSLEVQLPPKLEFHCRQGAEATSVLR